MTLARPRLPPATGAWRPGDPEGGRRWAALGPQDLERGGALPAVRVAYETWGSPRLGADGSVAVTLPRLNTAGTYQVQAAYDGSSGVAKSTATASLTVR